MWETYGSKLNIQVKNVTVSKHCVNETVLHRLRTPMRNRDHETNSNKQVSRITYPYTLIKYITELNVELEYMLSYIQNV